MKKLFLLLLMIFANVIYSQTSTLKITGTVVDSKGLTIPGVTVTSDELSTTTDFDGSYTVPVKSSKSLIRFTYIGFISQVVPVGTNKVINVKLVESLTTLDDVVVIGYGTQKRSSVTGSVAKFQGDKLDEVAVSRVDQALQGKIAGVQIQNISSEAGADPQITIRGAVSVSAGNEPLVVVDGQPNADGLGSINMADVESVEVLKDAASAAIYGSRGANGVVLITTKSGKSDKVKFNLRYQTGVKNAYDTYDIMTTSEYVTMLYDEYALRASDPSVTSNSILSEKNNNAAYYVEQALLGGKGTDWQDEALRTGVFQSIGFSASGGTKSTRYYVSLGYNGDEGMMIHSNYEKYNFLTKLNIDLSKKVKLDINVNPQYSVKEKPGESFTNFMRFPSFLPVYHTAATAAFVNTAFPSIEVGDLAQAVDFKGTYPPTGTIFILPDGSQMATVTNTTPWSTSNYNPVGSTNNQSNIQNDYRFQGAVNLTVELAPGLKFKTMGSMFMKYTDELDWDNTNASAADTSNSGNFIKNTFVDLLSENTLNYTKDFGKHSINLLAGYTAEKKRYKYSNVYATDFTTDDTRNLSSALTIVQAVSGAATQDDPNPDDSSASLDFTEGLISYLSRLNYAYDDKYMASLSIRADGSSVFGDGDKWGYFPAASLGWNVSRENFMQKATWLSKLLLRASYGVSGNNKIDYFQYVDQLDAASYSFGSGTGTVSSGVVPTSDTQANSDITWESTYQTNLGLDLSLFKNRFTFNIDVYQSKTDKLLLEQAAMAFTGVDQAIVNIGSMKNKGIEVEFSTTNIRTKNFKWITQGNISHTENEIIELGSEQYIRTTGERSEVYQAKAGDPLVQFFGYKTDGVWLSDDQITEAKAAGLTSSLSNVFTAGGLKLVDVNGDGVLDSDDRTVIGNPYPDFIWGVTNTFTYKAFDFSFALQGSQGGDLINGDYYYNETKRYNRNYNSNRWVSALNPGDGKTPYDNTGFNGMLTDYVVESATYAALKDVTIGFNMPSEYIERFGLSGMRLYFSGQNLYYLTPDSYRGINTEGRNTSGDYYSSSLTAGYQRGVFPSARTIIFGLDINF